MAILSYTFPPLYDPRHHYSYYKGVLHMYLAKQTLLYKLLGMTSLRKIWTLLFDTKWEKPRQLALELHDLWDTLENLFLQYLSALSEYESLQLQ